MTRLVGSRGRGEVKEMPGGGMKRRRRHFQGRKMHTRSCQNNTEGNKRMHKCMKNKAKKAVSKFPVFKGKTDSRNCSCY